jgi:hypothetical protein
MTRLGGLGLLLGCSVARGAGPCDPLPPPAGAVVSVATEAELQAAVGSLASGTTILVAPGTYDLTQTLVIGGGLSDVAVRGSTGNRDDVVLRGRGMSNAAFQNVPHGFLVQRVNGLLIADLTIRDVYYHPVQVQGEQDAQRVWLRNVRLLDGGEQLLKVSAAGPPGPYADDGIVECSVLEYTDRARSWYTNGVDVLAGARWVVRDNVFRNIRAPVGELAGPAVGWNAWQFTAASDADRARLGGDVAVGVAGCAAPTATVVPSCRDVGGARRAPPLRLYQVRAWCGGALEGP